MKPFKEFVNEGLSAQMVAADIVDGFLENLEEESGVEIPNQTRVENVYFSKKPISKQVYEKVAKQLSASDLKKISKYIRGFRVIDKGGFDFVIQNGKYGIVQSGSDLT